MSCYLSVQYVCVRAHVHNAIDEQKASMYQTACSWCMCVCAYLRVYAYGRACVHVICKYLVNILLCLYFIIAYGQFYFM